MAAQGMVGLLPTDDIDVTSGETAAAKHMREDFQFRVYVHLPVPMMAFAISAKNNSLQEVNAKMCFVSKLEMTLMATTLTAFHKAVRPSYGLPQGRKPHEF